MTSYLIEPYLINPIIPYLTLSYPTPPYLTLILQAKTTLIVQQESSIARLTSELEAMRKQASDRVQAVSLATLEGVRLAETTAAKLELQVTLPPYNI